MPLSSDTSRSPIPIDPETYRNLHRNLKQENTSNNDLPAYHSRSRSRGDPSPLERSMESTDPYKNDQGRFAQIKPFIMSPQNLQEILKQ